jgi:hypothetical protein
MNRSWSICSVAALALVACQGPAGPAGPAGPPGATAGGGSTVYSGSSPYQPKAWVACGVSLDLINNDGLAETYLHYVATVYSNDDAEVGCGAELGSAQNGSGYQYYPSYTQGANTLACLASYEFPSGDINAGYWSFEANLGPGLVVTYEDKSDSHNGISYTFTDPECHAKISTNGEDWTDTIISVLFKK